MIVIYTSPGCASCRKVKAWLRDHNIKFIEKNIFNVLLNKNEIKYLLSRSENGTDDIISKRSKIIQENKIDLESLSIDELIDFIIAHPSVLRRPIILNEDNFQIGYDKEEIETFIPRNELNELCKCDKTCPNFESCGKLRNV